MRLLLLVPGTGHFHCGSCLRDDWLARGLREQGHDVVVAPLYLPLVVEHGLPAGPVHMGGINVWLQQKSRLAARLPGWLANQLDRPGLLRWASRRGSLTAAPGLGALTLSMLAGEEGRQRREITRLVEWARGLPAPDVVVLSNALLVGVARSLREALECPVVVTLQGEAPFLDGLPGPWSERAWSALANACSQVHTFIPVSSWYGEHMQARLGLDTSRLRVVSNGLDSEGMLEEPPRLSQRGPPTIGFLARLCRDKGLPTLVEAFLLLARRGAVEDLRLHLAGTLLREDRPLLKSIRRRFHEQGLAEALIVQTDVTRRQKIAMLRSLSAFSVPATYGESFGLYLLEALACGVPCVQPRHAAFPEILEQTRGGILCEADDPRSLADGLESLLLDEERSQRLADAGRAAVLERFSAERMASEFADACRMTALTMENGNDA